MIELKGTYNQDCKIFIERSGNRSHRVGPEHSKPGNLAEYKYEQPDTHVGKGIVMDSPCRDTNGQPELYWCGHRLFRHHVQIKPANRKRTIPYTGPRHPAFHPHGNAYPKGKEFGRLVDYPLF